MALAKCLRFRPSVQVLQESVPFTKVATCRLRGCPSLYHNLDEELKVQLMSVSWSILAGGLGLCLVGWLFLLSFSRFCSGKFGHIFCCDQNLQVLIQFVGAKNSILDQTSTSESPEVDRLDRILQPR